MPAGEPSSGSSTAKPDGLSIETPALQLQEDSTAIQLDLTAPPPSALRQRPLPPQSDPPKEALSVTLKATPPRAKPSTTTHKEALEVTLRHSERQPSGKRKSDTRREALEVKLRHHSEADAEDAGEASPEKEGLVTLERLRKVPSTARKDGGRKSASEKLMKRASSLVVVFVLRS